MLKCFLQDNELFYVKTSPGYSAFFEFMNNWAMTLYDTHEGVSKSFRTESITKSTTTINTRWKAAQRVMTAKLARLTHKIAIQLHLVAESCTICSSRSRRPVWKLLDTPSYIHKSGVLSQISLLKICVCIAAEIPDGNVTSVDTGTCVEIIKLLEQFELKYTFPEVWRGAVRNRSDEFN
jgi:hypothetical protein